MVTLWTKSRKGKYKREHTLQKTSGDLSCQDSKLDFTQSLEKHQTRKALLHKHMCPCRLARACQCTWPAPQGSCLAMTLNSVRKRLFIVHSALFTMEAVGHVQGIKASWCCWASPGQVESKPCLVQIISMGGVTNTLIFPILADAAFLLTTNPYPCPNSITETLPQTRDLRVFEITSLD